MGAHHHTALHEVHVHLSPCKYAAYIDPAEAAISARPYPGWAPAQLHGDSAARSCPLGGGPPAINNTATQHHAPTGETNLLQKDRELTETAPISSSPQGPIV